MALHNVANAAQLQAALARAVGGDRIVLAAGDYGQVDITNRNYASNVTITSASKSNLAHFDGLTVIKSRNIVFDTLDMGRERGPRDAEFTPINHVRNGVNITFNAVKFHGDLEGGPVDDLMGLSIYDSANVKVTNSEFNDLVRGVYVLRSTNMQIDNNNFHDLRLDGVNVAATTGITLHNNVFKDFHPEPDDHADAIQFWNTGQTQGQSNISIKNNVIWFPEDYKHPLAGVQGIWISDPGAYGYRNVTVENNLVYSNDRWNGISVIGGNNVKINNNTVLSSTDESKVLWIRVEDSASVTMRNNVVEDTVIRNNPGAVWRANNLDLSETPLLRRLFSDLRDPDSILDLITPGFGYQPGAGPSTQPPAPPPFVKEPRVGTIAAAPTPVSDAEPTIFPMAAPKHMVEAAPLWAAHTTISAFDHFTALP